MCFFLPVCIFIYSSNYKLWYKTKKEGKNLYAVMGAIIMLDFCVFNCKPSTTILLRMYSTLLKTNKLATLQQKKIDEKQQIFSKLNKKSLADSGPWKRPKAIGKCTDGRIEGQSTQNALLVRQEGLLLHIIGHCFVHSVMQLMSWNWPSSSWARGRRAVYGPEAGVLDIFVFLEQIWVLSEWIFICCSSFWCASKQQKVSQFPFLWSLWSWSSSRGRKHGFWS